MRLNQLPFLLSGFIFLLPSQSFPQAAEVARGVVFADLNANGVQDEDEPGIAGVAVSNGRSVVQTDAQGRYEIPVTSDTIIAITKPAEFAVPLDDNNLPEFYYIHNPNGSPPQYFPGIEPTGPLPESIDFPLIPKPRTDEFKVIVMADPQPESYDELYHMQDKVLSELVGTEAAFAVVLGDIMFDHLNMFPDYILSISKAGIPFYHVVGNHDLNRDAPNNELSTETYKRYFGPVDFSWQEGQVHFVSMNNIKWIGAPSTGYRTGLDDGQLEWLRQDLAAAGPDKFVVLCMHGPAHGGRRLPGLDTILELVADHPGGLILSGHTHNNWFHTFGEEDGWTGEGAMMELNAVTVSGSHWSGPRDYLGVPLAMQSDGTPSGYTVLSFAGTDVRFRYKAGGMPVDHQMRIYPPGTHANGEAPGGMLVANIYYAPSDATVEYRLNGGDWRPMQNRVQADPLALHLFNGPANHAKPIVRAGQSRHIWEATVPEPMRRWRTNRWEIRAVSPDGTVLEGARIHTPR